MWGLWRSFAGLRSPLCPVRGAILVPDGLGWTVSAMPPDRKATPKAPPKRKATPMDRAVAAARAKGQTEGRAEGLGRALLMLGMGVGLEIVDFWTAHGCWRSCATSGDELRHYLARAMQVPWMEASRDARR